MRNHSNANNEGVLVLSWIKRVRIFQNKKVVHLFIPNSANFLYQTNQWTCYYKLIEAVVRRCSVKKVFLEISQNSQENTCVRVSFLIKLQAAPATLLKKRLWHRCFPVNFAKFLRTPFLKEHLRWLLLNLIIVHKRRKVFFRLLRL